MKSLRNAEYMSDCSSSQQVRLLPDTVNCRRPASSCQHGSGWLLDGRAKEGDLNSESCPKAKRQRRKEIEAKERRHFCRAVHLLFFRPYLYKPYTIFNVSFHPNSEVNVLFVDE